MMTMNTDRGDTETRKGKPGHDPCDMTGEVRCGLCGAVFIGWPWDYCQSCTDEETPGADDLEWIEFRKTNHMDRITPMWRVAVLCGRQRKNHPPNG